jgi:tRNA(Ile)-lysidine synthase
MSKTVELAINDLFQTLKPRVLWVGFSGGLDSAVLLDSLLRFCPSSVTIKALHVHHGLQASADEWVEHCRTFCLERDVELQVEKVRIEGRSNIEAQAREARYKVFGSYVAEGEYLCLAHHQRDQVETFFLNLMRGAGLSGLTGMPQVRPLNTHHQAWLIRPFLSVAYQDLVEYAQSHGLTWVDDPSNDSIKIKRNFIRHKLLPLFESVWPLAVEKVAQSISHLQESKQLLQELAQQDLAETEHNAERINFVQLQKLSVIRQKNVLRYWGQKFHQVHFDRAALDWFFNECFTASEKASPSRKFVNFELKRYRNFVYYVSELKDFTFKGCTRPGDWKQYGIEASETIGEGLSVAYLDKKNMRVRSLTEQDSIDRRSLKKWFQAQGVPPWKRANWPVIEINGELAVVVGYKVMEKYQAQAHEKALKFVALN